MSEDFIFFAVLLSLPFLYLIMYFISKFIILYLYDDSEKKGKGEKND